MPFPGCFFDFEDDGVRNAVETDYEIERRAVWEVGVKACVFLASYREYCHHEKLSLS
jgi:hypothetical protein